MIEDVVCDEFRVLFARDLEFAVVMSLALLVERTRSSYQRTDSLATTPQNDSLVRLTKAVKIFSSSPYPSTLLLSTTGTFNFHTTTAQDSLSRLNYM